MSAGRAVRGVQGRVGLASWVGGVPGWGTADGRGWGWGWGVPGPGAGPGCALSPHSHTEGATPVESDPARSSPRKRSCREVIYARSCPAESRRVPPSHPDQLSTRRGTCEGDPYLECDLYRVPNKCCCAVKCINVLSECDERRLTSGFNYLGLYKCNSEVSNSVKSAELYCDRFVCF